MKKLSNIVESIWSDIEDRSSGETIRKEDIITSNGELKERINALYREQGEGDTLDVSSLNKYKCDDLSNLFHNFNKVKQIIGLDTLDISKVTDMHNMFYGCKSLTELNISNYNVSNVTDMSYMFSGCSSLTELNIDNWDVSNVTDMSGMFYTCRSLTELNISNWNVSNVTNMGYMFGFCKNLKELYLSTWDVSNVTDMDFMFDGCEKLINTPKWYNE